MKISTVIKFVGFLSVCAVLWAGCGGVSQQLEVQYYTLSYEKPQITSSMPQLPISMRINPAQATSFYRTSRIAYATSPYTRGLYSYYYWEDTADKLLQTYIIRGIRDVGLFSDLLSSDSSRSCQFSLTLFVDEFIEMDRGSDKYAIVSFLATVEYEADSIVPVVGKTNHLIVFQKQYRVETRLEEKTLTALAKAMTQSVSTASSQLQLDLYKEISQVIRVTPKVKPKGK